MRELLQNAPETSFPASSLRNQRGENPENEVLRPSLVFLRRSQALSVNSIRLRLDYVTRNVLAARNNGAKGLGKFYCSVLSEAHNS